MIHIDAPNHQRNHLESLRRTALGDREARRDVLEVKPVRLALLFGFLDQLLAQFVLRLHLRRGHNEVALAANRHLACLRAAMAVGGAETGNRQPRHEEIFQHAVLDQLDAARLLAFVVIFVVSAQPRFPKGRQGRIVGHREEAGQHRLAHFLREGLALLRAALALAFEPVAKHLVEEDRSGPARENRRPVEGLSDRRLAQRLEACAQFADGCFHLRLRGQALGRLGLEGLRAEQVHAIVGARNGNGHQPRLQVRRDHLRSLGRGIVVGLVLSREDHHVQVHIGVVAEDARERAHPLFPGRAVHLHGRGRLAKRDLRRLLAKVGRGVLFFGVDFGLRFHAHVVVQRFSIAGVGGQPQ